VPFEGAAIAADAAHVRARSERAARNHGKRRIAFGRAGSLGEFGLHDKGIPVLHEDVPHEGELGALAMTFTVEPGIWIGG
jgi:hypothetical protein